MSAAQPPSGSPRVTLRRMAAFVLAAVIVALSAVVVRAATRTGGKLSITLTGAANGLRISSAGGTCVPSSSQPCSPSVTYTLSFSINPNQKHRVLFTSLPPYTAQDLTGTGNGWTVSFRASQFVCSGGGCQKSKDTLPQGSLYMEGPTVVCSSSYCSSSGSNVLPTILLSTTKPTPIDVGSAVAVAQESSKNGIGAQYVFTPRVWSCLRSGNGNGGNDQCAQIGSSTKSGALGLLVPQNLDPGSYSSTLTETISSGPVKQ